MAAMIGTSLHSLGMNCGRYHFVYQVPLPPPSPLQLQSFIVRIHFAATGRFAYYIYPCSVAHSDWR